MKEAAERQKLGAGLLGEMPGNAKWEERGHAGCLMEGPGGGRLGQKKERGGKAISLPEAFGA